MKKLFPTLVVLGGLVSLLALADRAGAADGLRERRVARRATEPWHGSYYEPAWGMPVALVVPPTAKTQEHYGWGVGNTRATPIYSKFGAGWPGPSVYDSRFFRPMPPWPSDTDQFGVYSVRGPW